MLKGFRIDKNPRVVPKSLLKQLCSIAYREVSLTINFLDVKYSGSEIKLASAGPMPPLLMYREHGW